MTVLLTGGCKSGKSSFAQAASCLLSGTRPRYYVATMVPHDAEDTARIARHVQERDGMRFTTLECADQILGVLERADAAGTFLVDSLTALVANELFPPVGVPRATGERLARELVCFAARVKNAVFVSDSIFCDSLGYTGETERYRQTLALCNRHLAGICDCVLELAAGIPVIRRGGRAAEELVKEVQGINCNQLMGELIIGGAYQGKLQYAAARYGLRADDICECSTMQPPDFSKRCLTCIERYVYYCMRQGVAPVRTFPSGTVLICTDIFCGVVPLSSDERQWRELAGRYVQRLAKTMHVTRIVCGIPEHLS